MPNKLQKVNITGTKYFHCFLMKDGTKVEAETTKKDYEQLGRKNPINPNIEGGTWVYSYGKRSVDTSGGELSEGEYFKDGNVVVAKLEDGMEHVTDNLDSMNEKRIRIISELKNKIIKKFIIKKIKYLKA